MRADSWRSEACAFFWGCSVDFVFLLPFYNQALLSCLSLRGSLSGGHTGVLGLVTLGLFDQLRWEYGPVPGGPLSSRKWEESFRQREVKQNPEVQAGQQQICLGHVALPFNLTPGGASESQ